MDIVLIIVAFVCVVVGIAGAVIPGLPGPPVAWVGLLILALTGSIDVPTAVVVVAAAVAVVITVVDYVVPSTFTKRFGGSRAGVWGCNVGLVLSILGLPFGPQGVLGIIFWPFVGALVGEMLAGKAAGQALKAAFGAFVGFLTGTLMKLVYGVAVLVYMVVRCVQALD